MKNLTPTQRSLLKYAVERGGSFELRSRPISTDHPSTQRTAINALVRAGLFTRTDGAPGVAPVVTITPKGIETHAALANEKAA